MSKCQPIDKEFIKDCKRVVSNFATAWCDNVSVWYDADPEHPYWTKRDYCAKASHHWGTAYCDWRGGKEELVNSLRKAGATNISARVEYNYIYVCFDEKIGTLKEHGLYVKPEKAEEK